MGEVGPYAYLPSHRVIGYVHSVAVGFLVLLSFARNADTGAHRLLQQPAIDPAESEIAFLAEGGRCPNSPLPSVPTSALTAVTRSPRGRRSASPADAGTWWT